MTPLDTPLLDDLTTCPHCWQTIRPSDLCEHDDPDTGPLCVDVCCPRWHQPLEAA